MSPDIILESRRRPQRKIRLRSLLFTVGLMLMTVNLFIEATQMFNDFQPHTLGAAILAFGTSIVAQVAHS